MNENGLMYTFRTKKAETECVVCDIILFISENQLMIRVSVHCYKNVSAATKRMNVLHGAIDTDMVVVVISVALFNLFLGGKST